MFIRRVLLLLSCSASLLACRTELDEPKQLEPGTERRESRVVKPAPEQEQGEHLPLLPRKEEQLDPLELPLPKGGSRGTSGEHPRPPFHLELPAELRSPSPTKIAWPDRYWGTPYGTPDYYREQIGEPASPSRDR